MEFEEFLLFLGGYLILFILFVFIPMIATLIIGIYLANHLDLSGIIWWAFLIVFYCVVTGLMSRIRS